MFAHSLYSLVVSLRLQFSTVHWTGGQGTLCSTPEPGEGLFQLSNGFFDKESVLSCRLFGTSPAVTDTRNAVSSTWRDSSTPNNTFKYNIVNHHNLHLLYKFISNLYLILLLFLIIAHFELGHILKFIPKQIYLLVCLTSNKWKKYELQIF